MRCCAARTPTAVSRARNIDEILCLLAEGIEASRGRYGSYLLRDRVNGRMQSRRGARTIAVSNGGTIPDTALYSVIVQPEGIQIATLDEDFAVESSAGDVILLGNTSWRIQRVESAGRVLVEDAHGQPPNVPFWRGEAPQRTFELSRFVSELAPGDQRANRRCDARIHQPVASRGSGDGGLAEAGVLRG